MVAVFIHLDDTDSDNGGLAVFPGNICSIKSIYIRAIQW